MEVNEDDPFELFICATEIRWTYYKDTQKILGKIQKAFERLLYIS